ncbi:trans-Golgi network integral membrane protein 1-like [Cataglyphis hispanica]|uniref:trans-Golgi network integral membrane protein 1-like n=1 Tax=Cataglyphis hispanica TaxID=1086592 RepID=UPI00217FDAED|nr:trans-Golgi network integral membrane protein 1-like [Cataglyphis hispanica]
MENRYALFRIALVLNILILVVSFTGVISAPMQPMSIIEVMKSDQNLCETSKFLYDSEYTKLCASLSYPNASLNVTEENLNIFLCLGVYDTAYKICQYSNQSPPLIPKINNTVLTSYVKNVTTYVKEFVPEAKLKQQEKFCDSLQGFTSSYNNTDSLLKPLIEKLNKSYKCQQICFDFEDKFRPLCAVFAWIKRFDDIKKAERTKTKDVITDPVTILSKEAASSNRIVGTTKKTYTEENNEKNINKFKANPENDHNKVEITYESEIVTTVKPDVEKMKSDAEKSSETQKKSNNTFRVTQPYKSPTFKENEKNTLDMKSDNDKIAKPINTLATDDLQVPSINNSADDVPKKDVVNKEKGEEINKEQNTDDLKTSTLSENTQDHYDVGNPEEDIEPNVADSNNDEDDPIQQSTRNQNGNVQEVFEPKNMRYPNIRTEDDSHFFTYFTVIIVACIAGYIGYHNKQKIFAIVLEGRRSRSNRGRRRPSTANYRKLDCTLEEAVTSQCNANVTHVIY